jgi:hypothetical protein
LYHPPLCFHDSQLNACTIIMHSILSVSDKEIQFNSQTYPP